MVLSAQTIRKICKEFYMITPFKESFKNNGLSGGLSSCGYDISIAEDVVIFSNGFCLASTVESFNIPSNIIGIVHDKSTWARQGLALQNTVIEPGWKGDSLTIELSNHSEKTIIISKNTPIAQIVFQYLDEPTELMYTGKYQNQKQGPQIAIFEK